MARAVRQGCPASGFLFATPDSVTLRRRLMHCIASLLVPTMLFLPISNVLDLLSLAARNRTAVNSGTLVNGRQ